MKHLNFLSKSSSRSCGHRVTTLALTVGSPSAHRRGAMLRLLSVLVLILTIGVGNVWGDVKLEFTTGTNDGGQAVSNADKANFMTSATKDLCTIGSVERAYYYSSKAAKYGGPRGIRVGKSSSPTNGIVTFSLASGSQIASTSIVVEASRYADDKAADLSIAVNGGSPLTAQALQDATTRNYTFSFSSTTVTSVTINTTKYAYIKSITIKSAAAPSYSITAQSNNTSYGTVSKDGVVITGSPKSGYRYASPAYSVSPANSATVSQNGNAFTVTPSANTTVTINFEAIPTHTLNYHDGDGDGTKSNVAEGTNLIEALGTPAASCDATSTTFVGWSTTNITTKTNTAPTFVASDAVVNSTTAAATYYAIYAKAGSETSVSGGDMSNSPGISGWTYAADGFYSGNGVKFTAVGHNIKSPDLSSNNYKNLTVKLKAGHNGGSGSILHIASIDADGDTIDLKTFTPTEAYGSQSTTYTFKLSGSEVIKYIAVKMNYKSKNLGMKYCQIYYTPLSEYISTCCDPLGSINGSFFWTTHFCPAWPAKHRS